MLWLVQKEIVLTKGTPLRAQEFKRGEGGERNLKPFSAHNQVKSKKDHHVRRCSTFLPKSSEEQKKSLHALRLSFIRRPISPLHHESFVHLSLGGAAPAAPHHLDTPLFFDVAFTVFLS